MTDISIKQLTFYFTGRSTFYWKLIFYLNFNALIGTFFTPGPLVCQTIFYLLVLTLIMAAQSGQSDGLILTFFDQTRPHQRQSLKFFIDLLDPDFETGMAPLLDPDIETGMAPPLATNLPE